MSESEGVGSNLNLSRSRARVCLGGGASPQPVSSVMELQACPSFRSRKSMWMDEICF